MKKEALRYVAFRATASDIHRLVRIQRLIQSTTTSETLRRALAIAEAHLEERR